MKTFVLAYGTEVAAANATENGTLIPIEELGVSQYATDEVFDEISNAGGFLPRRQLFGGNSDAVKEGKIQIGTYALVRGKDQFEPLGAVVNILPIAWRSKAMRLEEGAVESVFNPQHPDFKQIMLDSEEKDSKCLFGPEYLVWIFQQKCFATFLMGSKTARREARHLKPLLGKPATIKVVLVNNKSYKWHAPKCYPCSTPMSQDMLPGLDKVREEADKFNNPEEKTVEGLDTGAVAEAAATAGERER